MRVSPEGQRDADREHLLDRLQSLRTIVPVFAQELASARRQAARLRAENGRLLEQVRRLQKKRTGPGRIGLDDDVAPPVRSSRSTKGIGPRRVEPSERRLAHGVRPH
jgi:hypothetical protein